jgi:hypothetical protein
LEYCAHTSEITAISRTFNFGQDVASMAYSGERTAEAETVNLVSVIGSEEKAAPITE